MQFVTYVSETYVRIDSKENPKWKFSFFLFLDGIGASPPTVEREKERLKFHNWFSEGLPIEEMRVIEFSDIVGKCAKMPNRNTKYQIDMSKLKKKGESIL